ncbi:threonylcarbamoyl-AMP synthase [Candidatus Bathyarchaeota archaeon]|nr:threonylcarbamoyl-AMP synthase [Candidatus Bathyarchaeota archaeon]
MLEANEKNIETASNIILNGGIVIYPTETVYGIGCDPSNANAVKKIYMIKGREKKPLPLISADIESVQNLVVMNTIAMKFAEIFWPGPLMMILPSKVEFNELVSQGTNTLGIRVTSHPVANKLAKLSGGSIISTSANISGQKPALSAQEASKYFENDVDLILDGGVSESNQPSTIIDLSNKPTILRLGSITKEQIDNILDNL